LPSLLTHEDVRVVSPALEKYTKGPRPDGVWKRPDLSPRDRSIFTVAALISRVQIIEMPVNFALALEYGVGKCHVGGRRREGYLLSAWNRDRSAFRQ
jgi:4-carboxymuconolactone decarboxylase